jgi:hypothetical protein
MPVRMQGFRVLIASPSDLSEERDAAVEAMNEWNDLHAADEEIVLLPVRWETHSVPETGKRPHPLSIDRSLIPRTP